jgi:hypothetical protein
MRKDDLYPAKFDRLMRKVDLYPAEFDRLMCKGVY